MKPLLFALLFALAALAPAAPAPRPNVLILLADDAGWGDYSYTGNTQVHTPNIDSLARDGVSLDRFFVCPLCAPTRAEFLTGRYHPRTGVYGVSLGQERMNLDEHTIAEAFKAQGYATGIFGKWHNGSQWPYHPNARGFDEFYGYTHGHWGEYFDPPLERNGRMERAHGYIVNVLTDAAISFIDRHKAEPFFCYVPFTTPHSPWAVPQSDWQRFAGKELTLHGTQAKLEDADQTRCILAMMENQDANVGRILKKLEELGLVDNTIVVYFSDNGPSTHRWNGGMRGIKGGIDEGSVRVPCFFRWPGHFAKGKTINGIFGAVDLSPTLAALAHLPLVGNKPLDGLSLEPLLVGKASALPERLLFTTQARKISVRSPQYRLDDAGHLYDMVADPEQMKDIAADHPEIAGRLSIAVATWRTDALAGPIPPRGNAVDPRPLPIGYREFPITMLPARDGTPIGTVRRSASAPNSSYFVNWTSKNDRMEWNTEVHSTGDYEVAMDYTCPETDAGATIELACGTARLTAKVTPGWDPPLYTNQDTVPRHAESQMKDFHTLALGTIHLEAGHAPLTLRAVEIPGKSVADVLRLTLTLK